MSSRVCIFIAISHKNYIPNSILSSLKVFINVQQYPYFNLGLSKDLFDIKFTVTVVCPKHYVIST